MTAMKRRGFLGALLAGPVAAKAAADAGILEAPGAFGPMQLENGSTVGAALAGSSDELNVVEMIADYRTRLSRLAAMTEKNRRRARYDVRRFDSDLASNRSMSLACKISIQAERNVCREEANERSWIERRIERLISGEPDDFFD